MDLLNNAKNSIVDNFRSTKWLFYELEEVKDKLGQFENQDKHTDKGNLFNLEESIGSIDQRLRNLENLNYSMANQMFKIINSLNDSISTLNGNPLAKAREEGEEGTDKEEDRMEDDASLDKMQTDNRSPKDKDLISVEDLQIIKDATETIQDLDRRLVEQVKKM